MTACKWGIRIIVPRKQIQICQFIFHSMQEKNCFEFWVKPSGVQGSFLALHLESLLACLGNYMEFGALNLGWSHAREIFCSCTNSPHPHQPGFFFFDRKHSHNKKWIGLVCQVVNIPSTGFLGEKSAVDWQRLLCMTEKFLLTRLLLPT